ncbi:MAG: hypothetical protein N2B05_04880 [Gemmatimonadales bacterium]
MKLVMLAYLEGDEKCVDRLLADLDVAMFSRVAIEGHGPAGSGGWYVSGAPYRSEMFLVFTEDEKAEAILAGVQACSAVQDPKHPIRAFQLGVEDVAACGCQRPAPTTER